MNGDQSLLTRLRTRLYNKVLSTYGSSITIGVGHALLPCGVGRVAALWRRACQAGCQIGHFKPSALGHPTKGENGDDMEMMW